jgi:phage terminase large subunit
VNVDFPEKLEFLFRPSRYKAGHGGRGAAKSWGFARALLLKGSWNPLQILCAREFQNSIKESVHRLLSNQIEEMDLGSVYDVQDKTIKEKAKHGTVLSFEGLRQNVSRIKSYEGIDIAWVEEGEKVSKNSWNVLIPTIRKDDSEIWVTFNPEFEDDDTYERFVLNPPNNCTTVEINWRDNPWFPDVLEAERLSLKEKDPDSYDHVWEGKTRKWLDGAIYANELRAAYDDGRVTQVAYDPALAVFTAWDLGHTDDTAIWWFQMVGSEIHIIDSYAKSGGTPAEFAEQVLGRSVSLDIIDGKIKCTLGAPKPEIEHRAQYDYERHWLPHDAKAKVLAASGKSIQQQLSEALGGAKIRIVPMLSKEDGILAARTIFKSCYFDLDGTADGMKALRRYRREMQADDKSLQRNPKHDWSSHYADAFRYLAVACQGPKKPKRSEQTETNAWGRPIESDNWKVS